MSEHEEILKGFEHFRQAREVFANYEGEWFSGNDNHIGDIGEYWAMRYFISMNEDPTLAPKRTSPYDIKLKDNKFVSVKTMSKWNRKGFGGPINGIGDESWDYLVAVKLDDNFKVEKFCVVPYEEVQKKIKNKSRFQWWDWLKNFEKEFTL